MPNYSGTPPTSQGQLSTEMSAWTTAYQCPNQFAKEADKLGWLKEQVRLSRSYLEGSRAYPDIDRALDIIAGDSTGPLPVARSHVRINRLKRQIREIVATLTDFRLVGEFKTHNNQFFNNLAVLRKLYLGWYHRKDIRRAIRKVFQYAAVQGTGYASPRAELEFANVAGEIEVVLDTYGALGVLPHQMGTDHDIQKAYATTLYNEIPYHRCLAVYPEWKDRIKPSRQNPQYQKSAMTTVAKFLSPVLSLFGIGQAKSEEGSPFPMVDVYQTYVQDLTVNDTGSTIVMGDPCTSWYYEVPTLGSDLPAGKDAQGRPVTRKATIDDCRLYPLRRLIIWTDDVVIYDGTSKWWHGLVPIVQFRMDDWPWEFLGFSLVRDNAPIQDTIINLLRVIVDNANARMNPPVGYSPNIDKALATRLDPRQPGQRIQLDENMGESFKPLYDPRYYDIPPWIPQLLESLTSTMDYQMGVADMMAFAKAKQQAPGGDTLEKMLEAAGPLIKDIASNVESSYERLIYMTMCLMFQFYTTPRKIQLVGEDQITPEEYDYDPNNMIPSHLPGEDTSKPTMYSLLERAKHYMRQFWFWVEPGSLLNITGMTRQLMLIQASKAGVLPIDWWTIAESMGLSFAPEPDGTKNMLERFLAQSRLQAGIAAEAQGAINSANGGQPAGGQNGRPPSFQAEPKMVQKTDGSTTVRTSR